MEFIQVSQGQSGDCLVHDIVFDNYGRRFATCTTDGKIRIWDNTEDDNIPGAWSFAEISEAHSGPIWRLSWAHPEFGSLIASCSEDRTIGIWEEQLSVSKSGEGSKERWIGRARVSDCKKAVNDVKFAPKNLGLKIAAACADGAVRIYDGEIFSLQSWLLQHTLQVEETVVPDGAATLSSRHSEHGITCLAWNDCVFEPARLAIGGYSRRAVVWVFDGSSGSTGKWREECELGVVDASSGVIHDIAWAPAMGRSYHLIATASRDLSFKIHTLMRKSDGGIVYHSTHVESSPEITSPIWRVAWNATGTVLATSAEDGTLSLWRRNFAGVWKHVQTLPSNNIESSRMFQSIL